MQTIFYVCFGVGVGYAVISFFLGEILGVFHFDADVDFGGVTSPLKPVVIAVFLTVFGGTGIITGGMGLLITVSLSGVCGLIAAFCFYRFVIVPLFKMQNTGAVEMKNLIGMTAKVTELIPQGRYGKITYFVDGNTYSAPAKTEDGSSIERHAEVEITNIERNTFFVRTKSGKEMRHQ